MTPRQVIESVLDSYKHAGLGVIHTVAANIADNDVERALTYLLGAHDAAGASGNIALADLIRDCREELKRQFRSS